ncbi:MAG: hypothetical protein IKI56_05680 [Ruminococcus sp.]|nr:hypothetical protein [Ruminococcus sp.]
MNIDTFLIICFVILLILIVISFVYFFGIYRRREISDSSAEPKVPEKPPSARNNGYTAPSGSGTACPSAADNCNKNKTA